MAPKTSYTEAELRTYAETVLGPLAAALAITDFTDIVNEAIGEYGVDDVADIEGLTESKLLLACVRYKLWVFVADITVGKFTISDSGTSLNLAEIHKQAVARADAAQADVGRYQSELAQESVTTSVQFYDVTRADDEYETLGELAKVDLEDDEFS